MSDRIVISAFPAYLTLNKQYNEAGDLVAVGYSAPVKSLEEKIGALVLAKLRSGNGVPVERCLIRAIELEKL